MQIPRPYLVEVPSAALMADELAAACIRQARASRPTDAAYALRAGRQLALYLKEEYDRLRAILARIGG